MYCLACGIPKMKADPSDFTAVGLELVTAAAPAEEPPIPAKRKGRKLW